MALSSWTWAAYLHPLPNRKHSMVLLERVKSDRRSAQPPVGLEFGNEPVTSCLRRSPTIPGMLRQPLAINLELDRRSAIPLYRQLKYHIVQLMGSGQWPSGAPLPSVRQLASELNVATATVQRAYAELETQGALVSHSGRGVFVADVAIGVTEPAGDRSGVLRGVLARAISNARSLGYNADEITGMVKQLMDGARHHDISRRVVFVGEQHEFAEKYQTLLQEALGGLQVTVATLTVSDLHHDIENKLHALEPIRCFVSLVGTLADVRDVAASRGTPVVGLVVELTEDAQHALMELPHDMPIGLVAENKYLGSARALVRQYHGTEDKLVCANIGNRAALDRVLASCRIVLHTLGARSSVESRAPIGTRLIELLYRPNRASIARLRGLLAADLAQAPQT
jgi:GntR family transcriptional regulator